MLNPEAARLCDLLGNHPYALEIAGTKMVADKLSPADLLIRIEDVPYDVPMPANFAVEGRESVKRLLDASFFSLDPDVRELFLAFGAFFSPHATAYLLEVFLKRRRGAVLRGLDVLFEYSLVNHVKGLPGYWMHALTFSYAQEAYRHLYGEGHSNAISAVQEYVETHAGDFDLLAEDLDNILAAAEAAQGENPGAFVSINPHPCSNKRWTKGGFLFIKWNTPEQPALLLDLKPRLCYIAAKSRFTTA